MSVRTVPATGNLRGVVPVRKGAEPSPDPHRWAEHSPDLRKGAEPSPDLRRPADREWKNEIGAFVN